MTHGTIGEMLVVDCVVSQRQPALGLVVRQFPVWIENRGSRPKVRRRIAMAVEAPTHCQRRGLSHQRHLRDVAMAGGAADAFGDVDGVIEIDVVRQLVDFVPVDRPAARRDFRAPAPASRSGCKAASGRSCRCAWAGRRRRRRSQRRCGSSGSRGRGRRHDAAWLNGTGWS